MTQTISIIGAGLVGKVVARLASSAGFRVVVSNTRGAESLAPFVAELGPNARAASVNEAIAAGDIILVSIPLAAFEQLPAGTFAGKIVLDQTNYYPGMGGFHRPDLDSGELTSSELLQRHLRGAIVIKGLHNLSWLHMAANARPSGHPERTTLPVAGDNAQAKDAVFAFLNAIGYDAIDAGTLSESWRIEPGTPIYFWRYAPTVADDLSPEEAKAVYQKSGEPVPFAEARRLIENAKRPSPIGGTLEGMPQVHVDLFLEQASADTVKR